MKLLRLFTAIIFAFTFVTIASAQRADVSINLSEPFFDALLDSIYQNFDPPQFSIAASESKIDEIRYNSISRLDVFEPETAFGSGPQAGATISDRQICDESVKIVREMNGIRTSVRFREGKVYVPLAFSGSYAPPFVGCVDFAGWAETNIDLEFDQAGQRLVGRVRVLNVNLNGTNGIGGTLIAKMLQGSIDRKLNPIEIVRLDKVSFGFAVQNSGNIRMKAVAVRPEVSAGSLQIFVTYDFVKG